MTLGTFRSALYLLGRILGDIQAIRKGRIKQRLMRRLVGKILGRGFMGHF